MVYLNALNQINFLGPLRLALLLEHFGSYEEAWRAPGGSYEAIPGMAGYGARIEAERKSVEPEKEWQRLEKLGLSCLSVEDPGYPPLLKQVSKPPPLIYYKGSLEKAFLPAVAIVGSRRCTFYGKEVAANLAVELASSGVSIVSGMALGVDTAAHSGALEAGGYTVAVLGCGADQCYPPQNVALKEKIAASGAVISEFPAGTLPKPAHFPRRNRIISALSLGTVVVEATAKSGALITAGYALEQNREVFAVPGNVGSPYSRGCHRLIKEGARLVESAADILDELALDRFSGEQLSLDYPEELPADEKELLQLIPYQPQHIDDIIRNSGTSAAVTGAALLNLELKNKVRQLPGKYFCRI